LVNDIYVDSRYQKPSSSSFEKTKISGNADPNNRIRMNVLTFG
jgi:hypothetical protein